MVNSDTESLRMRNRFYRISLPNVHFQVKELMQFKELIDSIGLIRKIDLI